MISLPGYVIHRRIYASASTLVLRGVRIQDTLPVVFKIQRQEYPSPQDIVKFEQEYRITRQLKDISGVITPAFTFSCLY